MVANVTSAFSNTGVGTADLAVIIVYLAFCLAVGLWVKLIITLSYGPLVYSTAHLKGITSSEVERVSPVIDSICKIRVKRYAKMKQSEPKSSPQNQIGK